MPGRLRSSFRTGNLAENLGILLLRGVAAVAEVQRSEDVGIDAVGSLLRRDPDGNCYAEDSFVIQLKSGSESTLEYSGHALDWFLRQNQPIFIGRVSLKHSRIAIYPTHNVNHAVLALHAKRVVIHFGDSELPSPFILGMQMPWMGHAPDSATVWLGPPLLEWSISDLANSKWADSAYHVLKKFLPLARHEQELLSLGQCSLLTWSTNDAESIRSSVLMMKGQPEELNLVAQKCIPGLNALLLQASAGSDKAHSALLAALLALVGALRDIGVEDELTTSLVKVGLARLLKVETGNLGKDGTKSTEDEDTRGMQTLT